MCYYVSIMQEFTLGKEPQEKTTKQSFWELVRFVFIALIIVIPIRTLIAEPFVVSGSSMMPTFENGNYLIIDKLSYKFSSPERNDVVVFKYPDPSPSNPAKYFIKRIIGLPNEIIDIKGSTVTVKNKENPQGLILEEPYVKNIANNTTHFELKNDQYFVLGDNRSGSSDSRYWGAVPKQNMTGRAFLRLLPLNNINILPGSYKQKES